MKLIIPSMEYERSYADYIAELGDEERYPFPMDFEYDDFSRLLVKIENFSKGINIPDGFVPSTTYWMVSGGELIGVSNLRHYLNDKIRFIGGHIGLGIRPSYRGRGLGKTLLGLTIERAAGMGITDVHIHCHKDNEASVRMIVANGGVLDSEVAGNGSDKIVQRYIATVT